MSGAVAIISMLHEAAERNSAVRRFRDRPVLEWTLRRLARSRALAGVRLMCREDQAASVRPIAQSHSVQLVTRPRIASPHLDAVSAALRWSDGWRGGLLGACHFDEGFDAKLIQDVIADDLLNHVALIQPSAGLVDPALADGLVEHARARPELDLTFTQSAPGLAPVVISRRLLDRLAEADAHPGRLLSYSPDTPGRDPITSDACMAVAHPIARTLERFTLDSERRVRRIESATASLNGQLVSAGAEDLVALATSAKWAEPWPREITLELTTRRATRAVYSAAAHLTTGRGDMPLDVAKSILAQFADIEDLRVTLGGVGDPALHPELRRIVEHAEQRGVRAMHLETDLLDVSPEMLEWLANSPLDVLSVHLPAMAPLTYQRAMGVDGFARVIENLKVLLRSRKRRTPIIVPTFTKCGLNLEEMERWYDQWLRALGAAAIIGPSDCAGQIPDVACADMAGPNRRPCRRLDSRMTILSDGAIVACEEDVLGKHALGRAPADDPTVIWRMKLAALREAHRRGDWAANPLCGRCREWHRP
jgi:hypothetical protein